MNALQGRSAMQGVRGRLPWLAASIVVLVALPSTVLAQGKIRVAIWPEVVVEDKYAIVQFSGKVAAKDTVRKN
jgi:hypothetical protein